MGNQCSRCCDCLSASNQCPQIESTKRTQADAFTGTAHSRILTENRVELIAKLQPQLFMHQIDPRVRGLVSEYTGKEQLRMFLDILCRYPSEYFDNFCEVIAGLYPILFKLLKGRLPSTSESNHYMKPFCDKLKEGVMNAGNRPDNSIDTRIDLDTQFVPLKVTDVLESQFGYPFANEDRSFNYPGQRVGAGSNDLGMLDICEETSPGSSTLLTGRAGVGKSTLMQFLSREWAKGRWAARHSAVFLLNLRRLAHLDRRVSLSELLGQYADYVPSPLDENQPTVEWLENNEEKVMICTDGIDELADLIRLFRDTRKLKSHMRATPLEWCINLMRRDILRKSTLLLVSRPFSGLNELKFDRHIDVYGLTPEQVMRFINCNIRSERQQVVRETLAKNPVLLSISSITFYCAAITRILEEDESIDTEMLTTYTRITSFIVARFASRQAKQLQTKAPLLSDELYQCGPHLAELAYSGLRTDRQKLTRLVFSQDDFNAIGFLNEGIRQARQTGLLLSRDVKDLQNNETLQAEFVHLSIQELFCAAHILKCEAQQVETYLRDLNFSGRLSMGQLFLFGLAFDEQSKNVGRIHQVVKKNDEHGSHHSERRIKMLEHFTSLCQRRIDNHELLQIIQMAYETQMPNFAARAGRTLAEDDTLHLSNFQLTAVDMKALFFMMHHAKIDNLSLHGIFVDNASVLELKKHLVGTGINHLVLSDIQLTEEGINQLSEGIQASTKLTHLEVLNEEISKEAMMDLAEAVKLSSSLRHLHLSDNQLTDEAMKHLAGGVQSARSLSCLELSNHKLSSEGMRFLSDSIKKTETLQRLEFYNVKIDTDGVRYLADGIKKTKSLKELLLFDISFTDKAMRHLSDALENTSSLKCLELWFAKITTEGMKYLSNGIKSGRSLTHLKLYNNAVPAEGMNHLFDAARILRHLEVSLQHITDESMWCLAECLKSSKRLSHLQLDNNEITVQGIAHLADGIRTSKSLHHLAIFGNRLTPGAMRSLSSAIEVTESLTYLQLVWTGMTDKGLRYLSSAISSSSTFRCLQIACHNWTYDSLRSLFELCSSLTHLQLVNNVFRTEQRKCLSDFVHTQGHLRYEEKVLKMFGYYGKGKVDECNHIFQRFTQSPHINCTYL